MIITYINVNGILKTSKGVLDDLTGLYTFTFESINFIVSVIYKGQNVSFEALTDLEKYYVNQPAIVLPIDNNQFSPQDRVITLTVNDLQNYCPCDKAQAVQEPQEPQEPQPFTGLQKFRVWNDFVGGTSTFTSITIVNSDFMQLYQVDTDNDGDFEVNFNNVPIGTEDVMQFIAWGDQEMKNGDLPYQFTLQDVINLNHQNIDIVINSGR